ncbi:peptidylprolyl isomerase [Sagittula sp. S175]|uniref:peptidylprolyl isomerase n=1 Tax=Sagittula sp. S175 TaxID=3415129 RepID=UPI003C7D14CC
MPLKTSLSALALAAVLACSGLTAPAMAQGLFSPAIIVNDEVITGYELEQRKQMLRAMRAPGDVNRLAREQLIDDRLRLQAAKDAGITPTEQEILDGMEEFASRASLTREQFIQALGNEGVDEQTFRDFVRAGLSWRTLAGQRFAGGATVTDAEVDRAIAGNGGSSGVRVLVSELIMPMPPGQEEAIRERADRIAQLDSVDAFSAQARRFSATATRGAGGKLPWKDLTELPPPLQPILLGLRPGEVSDPIPLQGAIALFQLRAIEETEYKAAPPAAVEYAAYYMPGGRTEENLAKAAQISARLDRCDDLYGVAKGQPAEVLERGTLPVAEIPTDIAYELSKLDPGETSTALTRANGQTLVLLMLCGRTQQVTEEDVDRGEIFNSLRNQRIGGLAEGYLSQLRSDATIIDQ